jgi:hypothetical protein
LWDFERDNRPVFDSVIVVTDRRLLLVEYFHDFGEVEQRTAEAVNLVDDHDVDGFNVGHQASHRGPVKVAAGEPAVVVLFWQAGPAFSFLARDVCLAGFTLGIQCVEILVESFFG